ncbi:MAG: glutaredoxin family protein [Desulfatibacillaceae bacterium]
MRYDVRIFTMPTCPVCARAREFLRERGVDYQDVDITEDKHSYDALRAVAPNATTAPVIVVGEEVLEGFTEEHLDDALARLDRE